MIVNYLLTLCPLPDYKINSGKSKGDTGFSEKYLPNEPRSGRGITLKSLTEKLKAAGVDLSTGERKSTTSQSPKLSPLKNTDRPHKSSREKHNTGKSPKRSPQKYEKINKPNLFPYGPGYELIDLNILESLSDKELGKACRSDKYVAKLCNNNEF